MNLIYKIGEFLLYDNQFDWDYLILYNRRPTQNQDQLTPEGKYYDDVDYGFESDLPYAFQFTRGAFNQIFQLQQLNDPDIRDKSIQIIQDACKQEGLVILKVSNPNVLTFVKKHGTIWPNYNAYHVFFNETLAGTNITEYELAAHWTIGKSGYSTLRLFEFAHCREDSIDILNLQKQL